MTSIDERIVLDRDGNPSEVLIPYDQYQKLIRMCGLDLDEIEQKELREALEDSRNGNDEAFVHASEV